MVVSDKLRSESVSSHYHLLFTQHRRLISIVCNYVFIIFRTFLFRVYLLSVLPYVDTQILEYEYTSA
jgi:hypothetical protein